MRKLGISAPVISTENVLQNADWSSGGDRGTTFSGGQYAASRTTRLIGPHGVVRDGC